MFLNEIEPRDQTYRFTRDDPDGADAKVFVEHLWEFFCRYRGNTFAKVRELERASIVALW